MDRFDRLRSLLSIGVHEELCLFCPGDDDFIVRGATKTHSFNLPCRVSTLKDIKVSYVQEGNVILSYYKDDMNTTDYDDSLLYYVLSETDTLKFKPDIPLTVQLKASTGAGRIVTSEPYFLEVIDLIDDSLLYTEDHQYYVLEANVKMQKINVNNFIDAVTLSDYIYKCKFEFDSSWNNFEIKKAIFKDEYNHTIIVDIKSIGNDYECYVPTIILEKPGYIHVGVSGWHNDGTTEYHKPTIWSNRTRVKKGCLSDAHSSIDEVSKQIDRYYIYYGNSDDAYSLTDNSLLNLLQVTKKELLEDGFCWEGYNLERAYNVIAIPSNLNIECYKMIQDNFKIIPTYHTVDGNYTYYYFSSRSVGEFENQYYFREVK